MSKKQRKPISKKKNTSSNHHVNSKYKDTLFRMIFRDKKNLLSLYNALNKTSYTNPDDMKITTLEDVIYVGMKNDVSFLFSSIMNLFEHQSTFNPNMPVRGLLYLARIYQNYIRANSHFLRTAGPHFPDSPGHIKRTAWDISRAAHTRPPGCRCPPARR